MGTKHKLGLGHADRQTLSPIPASLTREKQRNAAAVSDARHGWIPVALPKEPSVEICPERRRRARVGGTGHARAADRTPRPSGGVPLVSVLPSRP
jgi:hypothetical protein